MTHQRILIATEAWHPQVNGVVRTLDTTVRTLRGWGHVVDVLEPSSFWTIPVPFYPEIRVCLPRPGRVYDRIRRFRPDDVHISTEGPLGRLVRRYCLNRGWRFSTSYHTRFPEYLAELARVPERWSYHVLRQFHNRAGALMVATPSLQLELKARGFTAPMCRWSRGVDLTLFRPHPHPHGDSPYPRPVLLYVGRVSAEKGIEDFLRLSTPGTKVVVGDGPARADLERRYPAAKFLGYRKGEALAACYAMADLFVFPSKTDTFGLVTIEALACGVPVAAYPVTGPKDIITHDALGALDHDLGAAVERALRTGNRAACIAEGRSYTWENCTRQFLENLVPVRG
ncbi:glycosyltransferase family 4 protein [Fimbriiglobus ruber]|uniref:Glycosyltransferase n=1 Tax=Fimbriiglobus ruber TaxID=1908690 RepID=A0A225D4W7_9BACT|nr:glycosyltransferase family 1 protein [Fimbriiglobus ruber]OWK36620.1 Glycosyltransferase [Fimbriiglobus ruber]